MSRGGDGATVELLVSTPSARNLVPQLDLPGRDVIPDPIRDTHEGAFAEPVENMLRTVSGKREAMSPPTRGYGIQVGTKPIDTYFDEFQVILDESVPAVPLPSARHTRKDSASALNLNREYRRFVYPNGAF
jgi:hypothetical protein